VEIGVVGSGVSGGGGAVGGGRSGGGRGGPENRVAELVVHGREDLESELYGFFEVLLPFHR